MPSMRYLYAVLAMVLIPLAATPPARAQNDPTIHMITYIDVAPAAKEQAAALLRPLAEASRKDAGNLLFQILQRTAPASQFVILATWKDQQALDGHEASAHYKAFRNGLAQVVTRDGRWGYIDKTGRFAWQPTRQGPD